MITFIALIIASIMIFPAITCSCDDECVDNAYEWAQNSRQWVLNHSDTIHTPEWSHPLLNHTYNDNNDNSHLPPIRHLVSVAGSYVFEHDERMLSGKLYHNAGVQHDEKDEDEEWRHKYGKNQLKKQQKNHKKDDDDYDDEEGNGNNDDDHHHRDPQDPGAALLVSFAHGFGNITLAAFRRRAEKVCDAGTPLSVVGFFFLLGSVLLHLFAWSSAKKLAKHPWMIAADAQRRLQRSSSNRNHGNGGGNAANTVINTSTVPINALSSNDEILYRFIPGTGFVPLHLTSTMNNNNNNAGTTTMITNGNENSNVTIPVPTAPIVQQQRYRASFAEPVSPTPSNPHTNNYGNNNTSAFADLKDSLVTTFQPVTQFTQSFSERFRQRRGYQPVAMEGSSTEFEMTPMHQGPVQRYYDNVNNNTANTTMVQHNPLASMPTITTGSIPLGPSIPTVGVAPSVVSIVAPPTQSNTISAANYGY